MEKQLESTLAAIRKNRTAGSRQLVLQAIEPLKNFSHISTAIQNYLTQLLWTRPAMAALRTAARFILSKRNGLPLPQIVEHTLALLHKSSEATIQRAIATLPPSGSLATISYSSLLATLIVSGIDQGKQWNIFCFRSTVQSTAYGEIFYRHLAQYGISAVLLDDTDPNPPVDFLLIGADTVSPTFGIINGSPSYRICSRLFFQLPIYCCAESFKYDDSLLLEPGFDFLPASFRITPISDSLWFSL